MRKIGIYGLGTVGSTLYYWLKANTNHLFRLNDPAKNHNDNTDDADVVFICVPVPSRSMGQDLTMVRQCLEKVLPRQKVFIRSTVIPGTCEMLSEEYGIEVNFMPEFLTERSSMEDMIRLPIVIGQDRPTNTQRTFNTNIFKAKKTIMYMTRKEAELTKLAHNCFGAMKVTYFNGIKSLCEKEGIDYPTVLNGILQPGHINRQHTQVPGPDGKRGYGGKCFPENITAFMGYLGANPLQALIKDTHCLNNFYRGLKDKKHFEGLPEGKVPMYDLQ